MTHCVVRGCRVIAAYSPKPAFVFCLLFGERGEAKLSWAQRWPSPLMLPGCHPFTLPVLTSLMHTSPEGSHLGVGWHAPGPESCGWQGVPGSLPRWPGAKAGHGLWAPLQPCSHPWGMPHWHEGRWRWVSAGLKFDVPSLMFFTKDRCLTGPTGYQVCASKAGL